MQEEPEIHRWAKKNWDTSVLASNDNFFLLSSPLCIEISLHTSEGDRLVLEQW